MTAVMGDVNTSQSSFWTKMADTELCSHTNRISSFDGKVQRKSGKVARSTSGCAKRSRVAQMNEVTTNEAEDDDIKGMF